MTTSIHETGASRLNSWKEVAAYLGKDVRTVIRWEQARGLPVHRLPGDTRSGVYAFRHEIDAWLTGQKSASVAIVEEVPLSVAAPAPVDQHRWPRVVAVACAAGIVLAVALTLALPQLVHSAQPALATFTTDSLQAFDDHHHLLWEHRFPERFATTAILGDLDPSTHQTLPQTGVNRAYFQDLFGDGQQEVLTITLFPSPAAPSDFYRQVLSCFSPTGKLLWSYEPHDAFTFGLRTYSGAWALHNFLASDEPGRKTLWLIATDPVWGKSFIVRLDADGHPTVQFVHSGGLNVLTRIHSPSGPLLWAGGFNDEYDTASLALLRDDQPFAVSPQTAGTHYPCANCATADPLAYFVLPRVDLSRVLHIPDNHVNKVLLNGSRVEVHQAEVTMDKRIIYDFSNDDAPRPLGVYYSSDLWSTHQDLERQHRIDHPLAQCPDRMHPPPVRVYRNGHWSEVSLPSVPLH